MDQSDYQTTVVTKVISLQCKVYVNVIIFKTEQQAGILTEFEATCIIKNHIKVI